MSKRASGKLKQIKREVAAEAARIMATEGQRNYLAAKQKAAGRLGITNKLALPSNTDVQAALKTYLELYGGSQRTEALQQLRQAALEAMRFLGEFSPRLVGPVLEGTADQHSRVSLHVFADTPDAIALFLQQQGIPYREETRRIRWHDNGHRYLPLFVTEANGTTVELCAFEPVDLRQAPPSPVDGKPQQRAAESEVALLIQLGPAAEITATAAMRS